MVSADPGSFRDPDSRVFYDGKQVCRVLTARGLHDVRALADSGLLEDPRLVRTRITDDLPPDLLTEHAAGVLVHERVPFVSYPYEWPFSMLKAAALIQLDLTLAALEHDLMLKDATPYNVQFVGTTPVFIDVGSFEPLREQELWVGYRQFCCLFLFPLLLQSSKGLDVQPWLRGSLQGIQPAQMRATMSARDRFRRGYLTHVFLHAKLDQRGASRSAVSKRVARPGVGRAVITANVRTLRRMVAKLEWRPPQGTWTRYGNANSYSDADAEAKDRFVRDVAQRQHWAMVWDLGANNGRHSRLVAPAADLVVAFDADHATVEALYRSLGDQDRILPLITDLLDPSPGLGWRNLERGTALSRGRPDLVLALALVHHLVISGNVPVREVVRWLADLGASLVLEVPDRDDPMVRTLLDGKRQGLHADYDRSTFEQYLNEAFVIHQSQDLSSRTLYFATPRGASS